MSALDLNQNSYSGLMSDPVKQRQISEILGDPPDCFKWMQCSIVDFEPGEALTIVLPVLDEYLNPARTMQGGVIGAAFDNAFGPLCHIASMNPRSVMVDMSTSFHRPAFGGDRLCIHARVKAKGRRKVHMVADAYNGENKLVASSNATYLILD